MSVFSICILNWINEKNWFALEKYKSTFLVILVKNVLFPPRAEYHLSLHKSPLKSHFEGKWTPVFSVELEFLLHEQSKISWVEKIIHPLFSFSYFFHFFTLLWLKIMLCTFDGKNTLLEDCGNVTLFNIYNYWIRE